MFAATSRMALSSKGYWELFPWWYSSSHSEVDTSLRQILLCVDLLFAFTE
jgi:hypothetical protein